MKCKSASRVLLLLCQLGSAVVGTYAFFQPVLLRSSLSTEVYLLETCERTRGVYQCGSNRESSNVCSEIDTRMRMVLTFLCVMLASNLMTAFVVLWELTGRQTPIHRLVYMSTAWSIVTCLMSLGILITTLIANLCSSPLTYSEQGGELGNGAFVFMGSLAMNTLPLIFYAVAPADTVGGANHLLDLDKNKDADSKMA